MKNSKITIRCEEEVYDEFVNLCFFEGRKKFGDILKELIEFYKENKKDKSEV